MDGSLNTNNMKAEFLKLAGVKTEKAFYKKYPTEAAFFKAHPEAKKMIKKAQVGADVNSNGIPDYLETNPSLGKNQFMKGDGSIGSFYQTPKAPTPYPGTMFKPVSIPQERVLPKPLVDMNDTEAPMFQNINMPVTEDVGFMNQVTESKSPEYAPLDDEETSGGNFLNKASKYAPYVGQFIGGIQNLKADTIKTKYKEQWANVSDPVAKAAGLRPEQRERRYVRPEDNILQPDQMFPSYGVGTNVLAKNGAEIQNTYAPGYLYDDLGYEPLDESNQVKQYFYGGGIPKAEGGFSTFMTSGGGDMLTGLAGYATGNNPGGQIGGAIGGAAGTAFGGPVGGMIGQSIGTLAGGLLDGNARRQKKAQERTMRNLNSAAMSQGAMQLQNQYSGFMEHGGQITNPQLITKFGEYSVDDLLVPPHDADMLRAGGNLRSYTPVSERGLSTMEEGGDLQTHWGGYAEPISQNPYLPANGETVMFRGQSHDESDGQGNTGIGITYGDAPVEVERGEPAIELQEPNGDTNLTVFGNLKIPNAYIPILGDEKAKGKKFKNYVAELSKQEKKQNSIIEKSTSILDALELGTSFDKLKLASLQANIQGANMKLKEIADKKINAASLQSAINDTAEEYGLDADALAKGKTKMDPNAFEEHARKGKTVTKQTTTPVKTTRKVKMKALDHIPKGQHRNEATGTWGRVTMKDVARMMMNNKWYDGWDDFDPSSKKDVEAFQIAFNKKAKEIGSDANVHVDGDLGEQTVSARFNEQVNTESGKNTTTTTIDSKDKNYEVVPYKRNALVDIYNQILPFIRPTDQEDLDPMQLTGEMYALSTNQLEPVQAQTFQPELGVPYDISLQDQLNANQADYRAAQRMVGYNPVAQAILNAQKYEANSKVLGEQFRANQAMRDQVYSKNRDILNDAKLKNLAIYDQQYQRQAEALSNTKATTQAALNSIASKYAQNKLENRTLGVYENMYNYRFDPSGRAVNMNPLFQANMPHMYGPDGKITHIASYDDKGSIKGYIPVSEKEEDVTNVEYSTPDDDYVTTTTTNDTTQRRGGKTKKNYSQSSIVRGFK